MFIEPELEASKITVGAGAFGEFIAAVFFYLYSKSVMKMSEYHQKLVLSQNIAISLKLSEGLPDGEKSDTQKKLIETLTNDVNKYLQSV